MATNRSSKRILYLDVVKAVAITLVCIGHATLLVTMDRPSVLREWIYAFHMPLFMMISGFFSFHALQKPFKEFIISKSLQLLIPAFSVSALTIITCFLIGWGNMAETARAEAIGGMWFLRTLFACYVFLWLVKRIPLSDKFLCPLSIIFACVFPHGYFLQFNWMLMFFWAGIILKKSFQSYERHRLQITIFSAIIFLFLGRHAVPILITYQNMAHHPLIILWQLVTALSASIAIMGLAYYLCLGKLTTAFKVVGGAGTYTLGIYGLQSIVLGRIFVKFIHFDLTQESFVISDFVIIPLLGIASTILCYYLTIWMKRYRITNLILFGNQY